MPIASVEALCNMALGYAGVRARINSIEEPSVAAQQCKTFYEQFRDDLLNDYKWPFATRRADLTPYSGSAYSSTTSYNDGSLVQFGALVYESIQAANLGNDPSQSPAWWRQVTRDGWAYCCPIPADSIDEQYVYEKPVNSQNSVNSSSPTQFAPIRAPRSDQRVPFAVEDANDGSGNRVLLTDCQRPVLVYTGKVESPMSFSGPFVKALAWKLAPALCLALRADPKAAAELEKKAEFETRESISTEMRGQREDPEPASEFEAAREG